MSDYKPSDGELDKFEQFASDMPRGAPITTRELLEVGVVPTRNEASRLMRYLDDNGVLSSTSRNSGFLLESLEALYFVKKGVSLVYPSNPNDPVILIGKNTTGAKLPRAISLTLYESGIEIVPSGVAKTGHQTVVMATVTIRPPFLLTPHYQRLVQDYMIKLGTPQGTTSIDTMRVGIPFELSASNAAGVASRPVALLYYLHTNKGTLLELGETVETVMDYERRRQTRREASRPDMSFSILEETFTEDVKPFVSQQTPKVQQELQKMIMDLWEPHVIRAPESKIQHTAVAAAQTTRKLASPKKHGWLSSLFGRSSD